MLCINSQILCEKWNRLVYVLYTWLIFHYIQRYWGCRHCFLFSLRVESKIFSSGSGAIFQLPPSPAKMLGGGGGEQLRNFQISRSELSSFLLFLGVRDVSSKQLKQVSIVGNITYQSIRNSHKSNFFVSSVNCFYFSKVENFTIYVCRCSHRLRGHTLFINIFAKTKSLANLF